MKVRYLVVIAAIMIAFLLLFAGGCKKKQEEIVSEPVKEPEPAPPAPVPEPEPVVDEGVVEIPETAVGEDYVGSEDLESGEFTQEGLMGDPQHSDATLAKDLTAEPERFSNFDCVMDEESGVKYITLKVTNTNADHEFMISPMGVAKGYNTYFMIRGMVDKDPGCEAEELAPGESTVCLKVGMDDVRFGNPTGINRLTIQSPDNAGKTFAEAVVVNCPE